jgi:hypothetical protein
VHVALRLLRFCSALVLLAACGEPIVGGSPFANTPPTVAPIDDVTTNEDTPATASVVLTDAESTDVLVVTATSSDESVIPNGGVVVSGSGATRTITLMPALNVSGTTTITVTIADEDDYVITETFVVTVVAVDDPPTITAVDDLTIDEDTSTAPIAFTIADVDTDLATLTVTTASGNTTLLPDANIVLAGSGASYTVTLTPVPNGFGSAGVTISVADATTTSTDAFTLNVTSVNDVPTISDIGPQITDEDTATGPIAFTVTDVESLATLVVTATSSGTTLVPVANITASCVSGACNVDVLPALNQNGSVTITLTVSDGEATAMDDFVLMVTPVNDLPVISEVTDRTIPEDGTTGAITFTVTDVENDPLTVTAMSSYGTLVPNAPANVTLVGAPNRTITITPAPGQFGVTTISIDVTDGGPTVSEPFIVTVTTVNDPATFTSTPADQTRPEDSANLVLPVTIDDVDVEDPEAGLSFAATSSDPTIVAVTIGGAGANRTVTLDPQLHRFGTVTITLVVDDGKTPVPASATFDITITQVNDAPVITRDTTGTISIVEDAGPTTIVIAVTDVDRGDGGFPAQTPLQTLTVTTSFTSNNPGLILSAVPNGTNTAVVVTIAQNQNGAETLTVTVTDNGTPTLASNIVIPISVLASNDPPTITQVANQNMLEDTPRVVTFDVGDIDVPAQTLTVSATSSNTTVIPDANLTFDVAAGGARTVSMTLSPALNRFANGITITVTLSDGLSDGVLPATMTFTVNVAPENDIPTISAIANQSVAEDSGPSPAYTFTVADVDDVVDCANVSVTNSMPAIATFSVSLPNTGTVGSCSITLTPVPNAVGTTNLTLVVSDDQPSSSLPENFSLTVTNVNDPPSIVLVAPGPFTTAEDTTSAAIAFTVTDIDNPPCSLTLSSTTGDPVLFPPAGRLFAVGCTAVGNSATRTFTVLPGADLFDLVGDTITLGVSDGGPEVAADPFTMTVTPLNDAPVMSAIGDRTVAEDPSPAPTIAFTISDVDVSDMDCDDVVVTSTGAAVASAIVTGTGGACTLTVTPNTDATGTTTFTLTITDAGALSDAETFDFIVTPTNDPPTIVLTLPGPFTTPEDTTSAQIGFTVTDIDGPLDDPACGLVLSTTSSNDALFPPAGRVFQPAGSCTEVGDSATRWITVTPGLNLFANGDTITITVSDGIGSDTATFTLDVTPENDPPVAVDDAFTTSPNTTITGDLTNSGPGDDTDPESATLGATPVVITTGGARFEVFADGTYSYTPPPGDTGPFTYSYTVTDGALTDTGSVTFTVSGPVIWYVNNLNPAVGTGTDVDPFRALASAQTASAADENIVLECGDAGTTNQTAGIVLKNGQELIGTTNNAFAGACPTGRPLISGTITLADDNTVENVNVTMSALAVNASSIGGATILRDMAITLSGGVTIDGTDTGHTLLLDDVTVTDGVGTGFVLNDAGTVTGSGTLSAVLTSGNPLRIEDSAISGTLTFTNVRTDAATTGTAVLLDTVSGTVDIDSLTLTTTTAFALSATAIGLLRIDAGNITTQRGVYATNSGLAVSLASLSVTTSSVVGLELVNNTGTFDANAVNFTMTGGRDAILLTNTGTVALGTAGASSVISVAGTNASNNARAIVSTGTDVDIVLSALVATTPDPNPIETNRPTVAITTASPSAFRIEGTSTLTPAGGRVDDGLSFIGPVDVFLRNMLSDYTFEEGVLATSATRVDIADCAFEDNGSGDGGEGPIELTNVPIVSLVRVSITSPDDERGILISTTVPMTSFTMDEVTIDDLTAAAMDGVSITVGAGGSIAAGTIDQLTCTVVNGACLRVNATGNTALTITDMESTGANQALVVNQDLAADLSVTLAGTNTFLDSTGDAVSLTTAATSTAAGSLTFATNAMTIGVDGDVVSGSGTRGMRIDGQGAAHTLVTLGANVDVFETLTGGIVVTATNGNGGVSFNATDIRVDVQAVQVGTQSALSFTTGGANTICTNVRTSLFVGNGFISAVGFTVGGGAISVPGYVIPGGFTAEQALVDVFTTGGLMNTVLTGQITLAGPGAITNVATCN